MVRVPLINRHRLDVVKSSGLVVLLLDPFLRSPQAEFAWLPQAAEGSAYRYESNLSAVDS
jgi:hypothetical protein